VTEYGEWFVEVGQESRHERIDEGVDPSEQFLLATTAVAG
jgi:hypothetical protein